jgi:two-component system, NarL family, nitrate/nitrite response regulator NarL
VLRVAIVDDHPIALHGIRAVLQAASQLRVVAAVTEVSALPRTAGGAVDADLVIMDMFLDGGRQPALAAIREVSGQRPVLVVSAAREPATVLAAMRAGACGYVTKHAAEEVYEEAVRTVLEKGFFLSAELADLIQAALDSKAPPAGAVELSPREQEALSYIAQGFTHQQAAKRMGVSITTVNTYVARIRTKLELGNKAELTIAALRYLNPPL